MGLASFFLEKKLWSCHLGVTRGCLFGSQPPYATLKAAIGIVSKVWLVLTVTFSMVVVPEISAMVVAPRLGEFGNQTSSKSLTSLGHYL